MAFLQYELWKDCSNNCKYCFNRNIKPVRNKVESLTYVLNSLREKNLEPGSSIGFIGGEFFGGQLENPKVKKLFYEVIDLAMCKIDTNPPGRFLITAALMSDDPSDWFEFCEHIHKYNLDEHVLLCTSWDAKYRFTEKTRQNWEQTVLETQKRYPKMKFHVEMILTEYLINGILDDTFSLREFENKWNCRVDLNIPYLPWFHERGEDKEMFSKRLPLFFPKRKTFLRLLMEKPNSINLAGISDCRFHSSELHYTLDDKNWIILPERHKMGTTCTNLRACANCCGYIDSEIKIQDDIKTYLKSCML